MPTLLASLLVKVLSSKVAGAVVLVLLKELAKRTASTVDDEVIKAVEQALGISDERVV